MRKYIGYITLVLTFFIWGSLYIISKYALAVVPPFTVLLCRYTGASALLGLMRLKSGWKKTKREDWKYFIQIGVLGYFAAVACQLISIQNMSGSMSSLLNAMNPVFISLMAVLILKESMTRGKLIAICLTVSGAIIVLVKSGSLSTPGLLASFANLILWSYVSVLIRKVSGKYSPVQIALCGMLVALCFNIPAAVVELHFRPCTFTAGAIIALLYMAFVATGIAHTLWNFSLGHLEASTCSMFYPMQPLVSALLGILLFRERITLGFIIGGFIISAGIILGVLSQKKRT